MDQNKQVIIEQLVQKKQKKTTVRGHFTWYTDGNRLKKEALHNTSHTVCCILYATDENINPEPGLDPVRGCYVKVAEKI